LAPAQRLPPPVSPGRRRSFAIGRGGSKLLRELRGKQTSPVRLSADGTRLFAVNTPDARLSVFDVTQPSNPRLLAEIPVGVEPVSVNPAATTRSGS